MDRPADEEANMFCILHESRVGYSSLRHGDCSAVLVRSHDMTGSVVRNEAFNPKTQGSHEIE